MLKIQFFGDVGPFFEKQPMDFSSLRSSLVGDQGFTDQFLRKACNRRLVLRNLDAAGLATSASMDLRFHDKDGGIQLIGPCRRRLR